MLQKRKGRERKGELRSFLPFPLEAKALDGPVFCRGIRNVAKTDTDEMFH